MSALWYSSQYDEIAEIKIYATQGWKVPRIEDPFWTLAHERVQPQEYSFRINEQWRVCNARSWLNLQANYDVQCAQDAAGVTIARIARACTTPGVHATT